MKMRWSSRIFTFLLLWFIGHGAFSQYTISEGQKENLWNSAIPFMSSYSPEEYGGDSQNWAFEQTPNGIIYVANSAGVLEFDGVKWRLMQTANSGSVRSLAKHSDDTIFVGASREIGYLKPDTNGEMQYQSLLPQLDSRYHDFTDVWSTYSIDDAVYFVSFQYIFKWHNNRFSVYLPSKSFVRDVIVDGKLLVNDSGNGLKILEKDSLRLLPSSDRVKSNPAMLMFGKDSILVFDRTDGAFLFDFKSYKPLKINGEQIFNGIDSYRAIALGNDDFLLTTLGQGVFIFDHRGNIKSHITKGQGLISDNVYSAFQDQNGAVWLGTANGLTRIEIASPIRKFDQRTGLTEGVFKTAIYDNKIIAGCFNGLFSKDVSTSTLSNLAFQKVPHTEKISGYFSLIPDGTDLWIGDAGIFLQQPNASIKFFTPKGEVTNGYVLLPSQFDDNKMLVTNSQGQLYELYGKGTNRIFSEPIAEINSRIHHLAEDNKGAVWLATYSNGLHKIEGLNESTTINATRDLRITHYDTLKGLPSLTENSVSMLNGILYSGTTEGLHTYEGGTDIFKRDTLLDRFFSKPDYSCGLLASGFDGSLWVPTFSENIDFQTRFFKISKNGVAQEIIEARRINDGQVFDINARQSGVVFISGPKGVAMYKENEGAKAPQFIPQVNLRKVEILNDSTVFGGHAEPNRPIKELEYPKNNLRFEFALADFDEPHRNLYQFMLDGNDQNWSPWTKETQKDYTNLSEGNYNFKVRAKNIYNQISEEDSYSFMILPPWYRTWWAYLFYSLATVMLVWLFAQWRSQQFRNKNLALEVLVNERTEEIRRKNKLLNHQTEKLKELDTMKTRLFANISHEFRTPLTLIKGPIEKLEQTNKNKISTPNIKMIRRNANRLLNLVNQLLDLSKLDSGKLKLNRAEGDVLKCIRAAASAFSSHAASRQMDYQIKIPSHLLWASFDRDKLEKIIYNLLSNAFKFTDDEGRVVIEAAFRSNRLHLKISDRGSGIAAEKLPHIFDRFFQVDDSYTKEKAGSGIGLALTKELVELMGGTIYVESEQGRGTLFRVVVPLEEIQSNRIEEPQEISVAVFGDDRGKVPEAKLGTSEIKVLIIEDNNDMRHFIREQLEPDYGILEARNGKEGLKMAHKMAPDLIVTDLMMPQMDGITLCKKLKTDIATSHIPVIMLTAKAGVENKLEGLETGADDYLTKPFNAKELQVRTRNLITQRQQLRELFSNNISLDPKDITVTSLDEEFLQSLLGLLEEKFSDSEFGVPQMQKELGMGKTRLHSKIKALTNHPPGELLRNFRLKRAAQLLLQKGDNISQTAYDVGFNSLSYFTRCFKENYGITPSEYIKKNS